MTLRAAVAFAPPHPRGYHAEMGSTVLLFVIGTTVEIGLIGSGIALYFVPNGRPLAKALTRAGVILGFTLGFFAIIISQLRSP